MKKYQNYRKAMFDYTGKCWYEIVKGTLINVDNTPYKFIQPIKDDILINFETGIVVGLLEYVNNSIDYINHEITEALKYFGNINEWGNEPKYFPTWYSHFDLKFREIFRTSMPIDYFGLDVIKFDRFIQPLENESTKDAIARKYSVDASNFVESILSNPPYLYGFYNPLYVKFESKGI